jgi:hypothetical protein
LDGFGRQFDKNIEGGIDWLRLLAVASSEETINIDDIFEETPFRRSFLLVSRLKAEHCSNYNKN